MTVISNRTQTKRSLKRAKMPKGDKTQPKRLSGQQSSEVEQEPCRKRLEEQFEQCGNPQTPATRGLGKVLKFEGTRKCLRNGAAKITKTFNSVRISLGLLSQRFKLTTKRRQIMEEGAMTPNAPTPHTRSRQVLGRTPTKLYSPFGIDSPYKTTTVHKEKGPLFRALVKS